MPKFKITPFAQKQIDEILENVCEFTGFSASAEVLLDELYRKFEMIAFMPSAIGRQREDGTREAFARRYRIIYEERGGVLLILAVIHSSRIYPRQPL